MLLTLILTGPVAACSEVHAPLPNYYRLRKTGSLRTHFFRFIVQTQFENIQCISRSHAALIKCDVTRYTLEGDLENTARASLGYQQ